MSLCAEGCVDSSYLVLDLRCDDEDNDDDDDIDDDIDDK